MDDGIVQLNLFTDKNLNINFMDMKNSQFLDVNLDNVFLVG